MYARYLFSRTTLAVFIAAALAGCSVTPEQLSDKDVMANAAENASTLAQDVAAVTGPIDLHQAFATYDQIQ